MGLDKKSSNELDTVDATCSWTTPGGEKHGYKTLSPLLNLRSLVAPGTWLSQGVTGRLVPSLIHRGGTESLHVSKIESRGGPRVRRDLWRWGWCTDLAVLGSADRTDAHLLRRKCRNRSSICHTSYSLSRSHTPSLLQRIRSSGLYRKALPTAKQNSMGYWLCGRSCLCID